MYDCSLPTLDWHMHFNKKTSGGIKLVYSPNPTLSLWNDSIKQMLPHASKISPLTYNWVKCRYRIRCTICVSGISFFMSFRFHVPIKTFKLFSLVCTRWCLVCTWWCLVCTRWRQFKKRVVYIQFESQIIPMTLGVSSKPKVLNRATKIVYLNFIHDMCILRNTEVAICIKLVILKRASFKCYIVRSSEDIIWKKWPTF